MPKLSLTRDKLLKVRKRAEISLAETQVKSYAKANHNSDVQRSSKICNFLETKSIDQIRLYVMKKIYKAEKNEKLSY